MALRDYYNKGLIIKPEIAENEILEEEGNRFEEFIREKKQKEIESRLAERMELFKVNESSF